MRKYTPESARLTILRRRSLPLALLSLQFIGSGILFPYYAFFQQHSLQLRGLAIGLALFGLWTMFGVGAGRSWAPWAILTLVSFKLTLDLFNWSMALDRRLLPLSELINVGLIVWVFRRQALDTVHVTRSQKIFFGSVLALAAWVAAWGIIRPASVNNAIPFMVPPLHARFLGVMYLSGATFMALGLAAEAWAEMRVTVPMIAIWTGMLGIVSLFHLEAFDWTQRPTWIWFFAYTAFPLIAAWITWQQRAQTSEAGGPFQKAGLRSFLRVQGTLVTLLALSLLTAPNFMVTIWPWKITPLLAHIYSAPFLSYGLGSLLAAQQRRWAEVRIPAIAMLVFDLGVLLASLRHATVFRSGSVAVWLWFGCFGISSLALTLFAASSGLRLEAGVASGASPASGIDERRP